MTQNYAKNHLTAEQWAKVDEAIAALDTALAPMLVALSADARQRVVKMGDGSVAFCRAALDVISANAGLMPRNFDIDEMRLDLEAHDALNARIVRLTQLLDKAHHTDMALGSDTMVAALEGYAYLKTAGKSEGVDSLRKLLGKRFDGQGQRAAPEPVSA